MLRDEHKLFFRQVFPELLVVLLQNLIGRSPVMGFVQQFRLFVALLLVTNNKFVQVLLLCLQRFYEQVLAANFSQGITVLAHVLEHLLVHGVKLLDYRSVWLHWNETNYNAYVPKSQFVLWTVAKSLLNKYISIVIVIQVQPIFIGQVK